MNSVEILTNDFTAEHPIEEGTYLWKTSLGIELISVYWREGRVEFGIDWDGYLAVNGRNVQQLQGKFLKLTFATIV